MSSMIREENREGLIVQVYDNGMERANGRIIKPPETNKITSDNASEFHRLRKEKKRKALVEAINDEVAPDVVERFGSMAFVAAVGQSVMRKALNSKDPKQVEAARFIFSETGVGELAPDVDPGAGPGDSRPRVLVLLAEIERRRLDNDSPGVIEGVVNGE
jgi:hypothetical protein